MSQDSESNSQSNSDLQDSPARLYRDLHNAFTPTKEEIECILSNEELTELCKKFPCKVQMNDWNLPHDIYICYKGRGKFNGKSSEKITKLILKAANRFKNNPKYSYCQEEIESVRYSDWKNRKLRNILYLKYKKTHPDYSINEGSAISSQNNILEEGSLRDLGNDASQIFNTESISINTQTNTERSQNLFSQQSENYKEFNERIPFTSTQSQEEEKNNK